MFVSVSKVGLHDSKVKTFTARIKNKDVGCFVVRRNGSYFAYVNLCRHLPVPLDGDGGDFFSYDKQAIQCHMHGALFKFETGECFSGPCEGDSLFSLAIVEEKNRLVVEIPDSLDVTLR